MIEFTAVAVATASICSSAGGPPFSVVGEVTGRALMIGEWWMGRGLAGSFVVGGGGRVPIFGVPRECGGVPLTQW